MPTGMGPGNQTGESMLIVTHGGKFHADDAWAVAVLMLLYPEAELVRTRDPAVIARADVAIDVGGEWNPAAGARPSASMKARGKVGRRIGMGFLVADVRARMCGWGHPS